MFVFHFYIQSFQENITQRKGTVFSLFPSASTRLDVLVSCYLYMALFSCLVHVCFLQITVYVGKRDFVDHVTKVDPIGKPIN